MNAAGERHGGRLHLPLRPLEGRPLAIVEALFNRYILENLQEATDGPLDPHTLSLMCNQFLMILGLVAAFTLCTMISQARWHTLSGATFAVQREDVLGYIRRSIPFRLYLRQARAERLEQVLRLVAAETAEKINISLALCSVGMLRELRLNMERAPHRILHHACRVWSILMFNSPAGDGIHINGIFAESHPGVGDAERA